LSEPHPSALIPDNKPPSIVGLGTIVVDHQVFLASLPEADTKGEVLEDRHQVGGPVPTALSLLQKFGLPTAFQGKWSDDPFGRMIESDLESQSIEFDPNLCRTAARSGFAHVWVEKETGRRSIAAYRGSDAIEPPDLLLKWLTQFDALHLDGWSTTAAISAAEAMKQSGRQVFLDLGSPKPHLAQLLQYVDVLNCPERLIRRLFGSENIEDGAKRLLAMGPKEITVTLGDSGAIHFNGDTTTRSNKFAVNAVDTNGAGDVFCGAIIYATVHHWDVEKKITFACAAAALKCRQLGNRDALPTLKEIEEFLISG
jgi:sugar/nucleoside kinase (ribokinase family)